MKKYKAHTFQHTHWDQEWYFTKQENEVEFVYHMKELFYGLDHNLFQYYHLDGKTSHLETYFRFCPDDLEKFKKYVQEGRIIMGPSYDGESCFIQTGEEVIKNLEVGMDQGDQYGGSSRVAYLPDSFGQIQDFPKIFNGFGIHDFIFRRGMSSEQGLKNEFIWKSNDESEVLVSVLQAGYSFAGLAFFEGRLIKNAGLNLDKKSIINQMRYLGETSARPGEFLFPAGKDNVPVMLHFKELMEQYNRESDEFEFVECSYEEYMKKLREEVKDFQVYKGEFYETEQHRVHHSIFSVRPDIKVTQDHCARMLSLCVEPLMTMCDSLGITYERGLVDEAWKLLLLSQTHSEATNSDEVNEQILARAKYADIYACAIRTYLSRKIAQSCKIEKAGRRVTVFNTLPTRRDLNIQMQVYTKNKDFAIYDGNVEVPYTIIKSEQVYGGWKRKDPQLFDTGKDYYVTDIIVCLENMGGCSYKTLVLAEDEKSTCIDVASKNPTYIENDALRLELYNGQVSIRLKKEDRFIKNAVYFDDCGDAGDTFDWDNPDHDMHQTFDFRNAEVTDCYQSERGSMITLQGTVKVPANLEEREQRVCSGELTYQVCFETRKGSDLLTIKGYVINRAKNHKFRLVVAPGICTENSIAGTQFGAVKRINYPKAMDYWKEKKWLERPDPIYPLLNYVSLADGELCATVYTKSTKEYEVTGETFDRLALTIYRAVGHFGLPDLNRRPGRASGIPEQIMECPLSQLMRQKLTFEYCLGFTREYDSEAMMNTYVNLAAEDVWFEEQEYNRTFIPMKYFEVNNAVVPIPEADQLLELKDSRLVFSSLQKSKSDNAYLLRLFNAEDDCVEGGTIVMKKPYTHMELVDFRENKTGETEADLGLVAGGKILTVKIYLK